jgi:hypothetical protein
MRRGDEPVVLVPADFGLEQINLRSWWEKSFARPRRAVEGAARAVVTRWGLGQGRQALLGPILVGGLS